MVQGPGPPTNVPPLIRPESPAQTPGGGRPLNMPPSAAPARAPGNAAGMQATNGTDTVQVSQQALRTSMNGGPANAVPPNAATTRQAAVVGEPEPPPPLSPKRPPPPEEEEMNVTAREEQVQRPGPQPAQIPEFMQEFGPGQAEGQNINLMA